MEPAYTEQLVYASTVDGLDLEGVLIVPAAAPVRPPVLWIHGNGARFSDCAYVEIGREVARRGSAFLSANTRGHDRLVLFFRGNDVFPGGAAWERFDESVHDIAAWIAILGDSAILAGHDGGAAKVVYYQAQRQDSRVRGLIAASPAVHTNTNPERLTLARRLLSEGNGEELLPRVPGSPSWNFMSAQTVASRDAVAGHAFAADEAPPWIASVRCPVLAFYGTSEEYAGEHLDLIRENTGGACETQLIQNADHSYRGRQREISRQITHWIENLTSDRH